MLCHIFERQRTVNSHTDCTCKCSHVPYDFRKFVSPSVHMKQEQQLWHVMSPPEMCLLFFFFLFNHKTGLQCKRVPVWPPYRNICRLSDQIGSCNGGCRMCCYSSSETSKHGPIISVGLSCGIWQCDVGSGPLDWNMRALWIRVAAEGR